MRGANKILKLATVFVFISLLLSAGFAIAQETQVAEIGNLNSLKINLEVMPDSSIMVEQIFEGLNIYQPSFSWQVDAKKIDDLTVEESGSAIPSSNVDVQGGDLSRITFPVSYYSGANLKISYKASGNLKIKDDKIFLRMIIFDRPGLYIDKIKINLVLPDDAEEAKKYQRYYAVHGIDSSGQQAESPSHLIYEASNAASVASYAIEDSFISSSIRFPLGDRIRFYFNNLSGLSLFFFALPLPLITLIILLILQIRYRNSVRIRRDLPASPNMPDDIPPALLDLLYQGDITEAGVSATIIDLIKRGVIIIVDKGDSITFGKKDAKIPLQNYEQRIINELFKRQGIKTTLSELQKIEEEKLIEPMFEKVYQEIYAIGASKGYFVRDPYRLKLIHHLIGIGLFLLSIIIYILVIIFFPTNPLMLLPAFGITVASLLILYLAKIIPDRTPEGKAELERWLSFKKYLLGHHPITEEKNMALGYLPQAEALGATEEWVGHFKNLPTPMPEFYISAMPYVSTSEWMVRTVNACRAVAEEIEELKGY